MCTEKEVLVVVVEAEATALVELNTLLFVCYCKAFFFVRIARPFDSN